MCSCIRETFNLTSCLLDNCAYVSVYGWQMREVGGPLLALDAVISWTPTERTSN